MTLAPHASVANDLHRTSATGFCRDAHGSHSTSMVLGRSGRVKRPLDRLGIVLNDFEQDESQRPEAPALFPIAQPDGEATGRLRHLVDHA